MNSHRTEENNNAKSHLQIHQNNQSQNIKTGGNKQFDGKHLDAPKGRAKMMNSYSPLPSARGEGFDSAPTSSRSFMNDSGDVSTLHYYRSQQRQQKKDTLISGAAAVQKETRDLLVELGARMRQHHTLGLVAAEIERLLKDQGLEETEDQSTNKPSLEKTSTDGRAITSFVLDEDASLNFKSSYFPSAVITAYDIFLSNEQQQIMREQEDAPAQSEHHFRCHQHLQHLQFLMRVAKDFVRLEKYIFFRENQLRDSQAVFSTEMAKIHEAKARLESYKATLGDNRPTGTEQATSVSSKASTTHMGGSGGEREDASTASAVPLYSSSSIVPLSSASSPLLNASQAPRSPIGACSKLLLARERLRHLSERLTFLEQQTPPEAEADLRLLLASKKNKDSLISGPECTSSRSNKPHHGDNNSNTSPNPEEGDLQLQLQLSDTRNSSDAYESPSPIFATSTDTAAGAGGRGGGGSAGLGLGLGLEDYEGASKEHVANGVEARSAVEQQELEMDGGRSSVPLTSSASIIRREALLLSSPSPITSPSSVSGAALEEGEDPASPSPSSSTLSTASQSFLSPLELAHRRKVSTERTKLSLLASRHEKLLAVKTLMMEEAKARKAIQREWGSINILEVYMEEVVSVLLDESSHGVGGRGGMSCRDGDRKDDDLSEAVTGSGECLSALQSPRGDAPNVPNASALKNTCAKREQGTLVPGKQLLHGMCTTAKANRPFEAFRLQQDVIAEREIKQLRTLYAQKIRELESLESRVSMISAAREEEEKRAATEDNTQNNKSQKHFAKDEIAALDGRTITVVSAERLKVEVAQQELEIAEKQDLILALEHDLSLAGGYVDLEAMLLELRPQGPDTSPPVGHEASSMLGKMAQWAAAYGNHTIDCAKEMAMSEVESIRLTEMIADLEVQRSDFMIKAQYKGAHSYEQQQLNTLDRYRELEHALAAYEKEATQLRVSIGELREKAKDRAVANEAIDASRREYFGKEAELEGAKRDLQREIDQMSFVVASMQRAMESIESRS